MNSTTGSFITHTTYWFIFSLEALFWTPNSSVLDSTLIMVLVKPVPVLLHSIYTIP